MALCPAGRHDRDPRPPSRGRAAFTLMEVLAVLLLMGIVFAVALDVYMDLSSATRRASDHTRGVRRATAILDRVARDLESTVLVRKPPALDPLSHPWLFLAESRYADGGADQLKFVTRGHRPRSSDAHESDLAVVSYTVRRGENDDLELHRSSSPRLPEGLDREFPPHEDALLLADGLASFALRFQGDDGEWATSWDSSQLTDSSELPQAVEIRLALLSREDPEAEAEVYGRTVVLPLQPLDLVALLDPTGEGLGDGSAEEEGEEGAGGEGDPESAGPCMTGFTMAECIDHGKAQGSPAGVSLIATWGRSQACFSTFGQHVVPRFRHAKCQ